MIYNTSHIYIIHSPGALRFTDYFAHVQLVSDMLANKEFTNTAGKHALTHFWYSETPPTVHCTLCTSHLTTSATSSSQTKHHCTTNAFAAIVPGARQGTGQSYADMENIKDYRRLV